MRRIRFMFSFCLCILVLASFHMAAKASLQTLPPGSFQAGETTTQTVLLTPAGFYGEVPFGRWQLLEGYASEIYEPASGPQASWWMPGYDDSAWASTTEVGWNPAWNTNSWAVIPALGNYAAGYRSVGWDESATWLHRRDFTITIPPGAVISGAVIQTFVDDRQSVYINGHRLPFNNSQPAGYAFDASYLHAGANTLAMTDYSLGWTSGLQYILSVQFTQMDPPTVRLLVDGVPGPVTKTAPGSYTLSWSSTNAADCTAASSEGDWSGPAAAAGAQFLSGKPSGSYTYTLTCVNLAGAASASVSAVVLDPLSGPITAMYADLVLFALRVGQPAQTLSGWASGGTPPYHLVVFVQSPSGILTRYTREGTPWILGPEDVPDENFGVTEEGTWTAWAEITDLTGNVFVTSSVTWNVAWFPVHGQP